MKKETVYTECKNLDSEEYDIFCNYNQDIESYEELKNNYQDDNENTVNNATGFIGISCDGEIEELWYSEDISPWDLKADYRLLINQGKII